jgi:hypothetical protein
MKFMMDCVYVIERKENNYDKRKNNIRRNENLHR